MKSHHSHTGSALDKAVSAEDNIVNECQRLVHRILRHQVFENSMSIVILFNFVAIVLETDALAQSDHVPAWIDVAGWIVLVVFIVEMMGRIYVERTLFFQDGMNVFDFTIVATDSIFSFLSLLFGSLFPISILRIFRLCKVARVSKIFRVFPELRLMMAGMLGAMSAIFWGAVLLAFALVVWSIIAVQFIHPLNEELEDKGVYGDCGRCGQAYANVMSATLTFSQQIVAGDSWGQVTIPIIEHFPLSAVFFVAVFLTVGMAVLNLMLAVCVDVATQARGKLQKEIHQEKLLTEQQLTTELIHICREMDADGSGELTKPELVDGYENIEHFRAILQELDIGREDLEIVWMLMDSDKSGLVSYTEFLAQLLSMKTSDTQFMLAYIKYYITIIREQMTGQIEAVHADVTKIQKHLQETVDKEVGAVAKDSEKLDMLLTEFGTGGPLAKSVQQDTKAGRPGQMVATPTGFTPNAFGPIIESKSETSKFLQQSTKDVEFENLITETRSKQAELMVAIKEISDQLRIRPTRLPAGVGPESASSGASNWMPFACQQNCTAPKDVTRQLIVHPAGHSNSSGFGAG
jgi:bacterioferritin-associated ferredoxin